MDFVTHFIAQLQAPEEDVRGAAAVALGTLADLRAIDALVAYLHDPAKADPPRLEYTTMMDYELYGEPPLPSVREEVIESVGEIGTSAAVAPLVEALQEPIHAIRHAAAQALGKVGDRRAALPLIQALKRAYGEEEWAILIALGQLHDPVAFEPLRQWLPRSEGAVRALGILGDLRAVPLLLPMTAAPHSSLRRVAALDALGQLGDKQAHETVIACLHDADDMVGTAAARALIRLGDAQDIEVLIPLLDDQQAVPSAIRALDTLGGERAFPILASRLKEASGGKREAIISALGATGDTRAIPLLLPLLRDESRFGRSAAVEALGTLRATQAVEQILPLLQDQDADVRQNAALALGKLGDARAVTPLLQALQDPDWFVPGCAALALGELGDARAIAPLLTMLHPLRRRDEYRQIAGALERLQTASAPVADHPQSEPTEPGERVQAEPEQQPSGPALSRSVHGQSDLRFLEDWPLLTELILSDCRQIRDLSPLAHLKSLERLFLFDAQQVRDLRPLSGLTQLTSLALTGCHHLTDLGPLNRLTQLRHLDLSHCNQVSDLTPLATLAQLTSVELSYCFGVYDLSPLAHLNHLTHLTMYGCPPSDAQRLPLAKLYPQLIIYQGGED